ncbi:MAG: hypothetical protein S0880_25510 [Actinomycetota bacterium]|nr:hypothetical protein [Actinomycetota bacterium]
MVDLSGVTTTNDPSLSSREPRRVTFDPSLPVRLALLSAVTIAALAFPGTLPVLAVITAVAVVVSARQIVHELSGRALPD